jgi:hypothetical protein
LGSTGGVATTTTFYEAALTNASTLPVEIIPASFVPSQACTVVCVVRAADSQNGQYAYSLRGIFTSGGNLNVTTDTWYESVAGMVLQLFNTGGYIILRVAGMPSAARTRFSVTCTQYGVADA